MIAPGQNTVDIMHDPTVQRARYRNLFVCGRLWPCPVCAARISEVRRQELIKGMNSIGDRAILCTYTLSHNKDEALSEVRKKLKDAYRLMWSGRWANDMKKTWGIVGSIKASEVTYGKNGWHPHYHVLMFIDPVHELSEIEDALVPTLKKRWSGVVDTQDGYASWANGCDVKIAYQDVIEYITKIGHDPTDDLGWNIAMEVTKGLLKAGKDGGLTPFQLLLVYAGSGSASQLMGQKFCEYVEEFKGEHQLQPSPKLREYMKLGKKEVTDKEAAEQIDDSYVLLCSLNRSQWDHIIRSDLRAELLNVAAAGDIEHLWDWLTSIGISPNGKIDGVRFLFRP